MRILLVEDHKPTSEEMQALILTEPDMTIVAAVESGEEAVERAFQEKPDIVIMDILLSGMNGIEATKKILARQPEMKVLVLSNHFGDSLFRSVLDSGALGYVRKNRAFEELIPALRSVAIGKEYIGNGAISQRP